MTSRLKLSMRLALTLALLAGTSFLRAELKPEKIYQKVLSSVMTLEVETDTGERFIGTGFLALEDDVAVTAWHVLSDARRVRALFADGERVDVIGCIDKNPAHDIALLKLQKRPRARRAVLSATPPLVGARAYVIGAPRGYDFSISDGLISQIRRVDGFEQFQVSCPISPGNSGGPLLNENGEVIAVTSWMKSDAQNVSFAVPVREVLRLNARQRPVAWEKLTSPQHAQRVTTAGKGNWTASTKDAPPAGNFSDFKKRLEKSAGKTVTVVIREGTGEETFTFAVPSGQTE